jgi:hypothetical protein
MSFNIRPIEFMRELGWSPKTRGQWLTIQRCPFCGGGSSGDVFTFAVHSTDGNFFCHRAKCGERGNFWKLIESASYNPRDYWEPEDKQQSKKTKWRYGK